MQRSGDSHKRGGTLVGVKRFRVALGIRAQLLLVLTVFLVLPLLGYEYVRELERVLRDAQERTLAGTAQAVATALHDRPRLFDVRPCRWNRSRRPRARARRRPPAPMRATSAFRIRARSRRSSQILHGLSRTTARIWVIDRDLNVLARAGSLQTPPTPDERRRARRRRRWRVVERTLLHPLYALVLDAADARTSADEGAAHDARRAREVDGALSGILTTDRRPHARTAARRSSPPRIRSGSATRCAAR